MYSDKRHSEEQLLREQWPGKDSEAPVTTPSNRPKQRRHVYMWIFQGLLFFLSASMLLASLLLHSKPPSDQNCEDYTPMWSPALEAVEGTGGFHRFDGSFATPNTYKGTPSPSIDKAWADITYEEGGVFSIDEATLQAVNASREYSVELSPEIGGGYMASVEVLHQLHCLNMLRQASYEDYYKDKAGPWKDSPQTLRYHLDHCIDNLRQKLMCDADTGILTYVWVEGHPAPFPDFNVQHKCRNYNTLRDWVTDHQTYTKPGYGIERQPGFQEMQSPP